MTWELRDGSCLNPVTGLASLDDKIVDVTITDPPYSQYVDGNFVTMGKHRSGTVKGRPRQERVRRVEIGIGVMSDADIDVLCAQIVRVTKRWILAFCAFEQIHRYQAAIMKAGGRYVRACAWEKPDATPQLSGDRPATWGECLVVGYAGTGAMRWNAGGKRGIYRAGVCRGYERTEHPTQKPLRLMRELVADFTNPGELILDPYAGSGSTGVACRALGRRFIGWEINPEYAAIARQRLSGATPTTAGQLALL
jgi:site-specific DNA-methyltransferase (adenine-specific)